MMDMWNLEKTQLKERLQMYGECSCYLVPLDYTLAHLRIKEASLGFGCLFHSLVPADRKVDGSQ